MRAASIWQIPLLCVVLAAACSSETAPDDLAPMDPSGTGDDLEDLFGDDEDEPAPEPPGEDMGEGEEPPAAGYCDAVADWDADWAAREAELIELINAARVEGRDCGEIGVRPPAPPLTATPALSCASRVHSLDMAARDYFDHTTPEGNDPNWRLGQAGFTGHKWAESIGAGFMSPAELLEGWLAKEVHCGNIMDPEFTGVGVGYAFGAESAYAHYWTLMLSD